MAGRLQRRNGGKKVKKEINIAFTCANYGPMWAPVVASWLRLVGYTSRQFNLTQVGRLGGVGITDRMYTMTAENTLVQEVLANPDFTHIFMTEIDMILPHDAIAKLVALDKDMASGLYFLRSDLPEGRGQPCLYKRAPGMTLEDAQKEYSEYLHTPVSLFPQMEPFPVDCAGLGCVLVKREVFEKLPRPWFDLRAGDKVSVGYGSDIYFYKHARDHGFQLWVDPTVQCGQIDYYETTIADWKWQLDNNPGFAGRGYIIGQGGPSL